MEPKRLIRYIIIIVCLMTAVAQACDHQVDIDAPDVIGAVGESVTITASASCDHSCIMNYEWYDSSDSLLETVSDYTYTPSAAGDETFTVEVVSFSHPAVCEDYKDVTVSVVEIDLDSAGISDTNEETDSYNIFVNDNFDEETSATPLSGHVNCFEKDNDNDSISGDSDDEIGDLTLTYDLAGASGIELMFTCDSSIKLYYGSTLIVSETRYDPSTLSGDLKIEGVSATESDLVVALMRPSGGTEICRDTIKVKAIPLDIESVDRAPSDDQHEICDKEKLIIQVNNDDDDEDGTVDNVDAGFVDDDLVQITLHAPDGADAADISGSITVTFPSNINGWENDDKTASASGSYSFSDLPKDIWLEGDSASSGVLDSEIKVEMTLDSGVMCRDSIKYTVIDVDIDMADVSEADEQKVGGFIALNDDDDNQNGTSDKGENPVVSSGPGTYNEDNLVMITLQKIVPNSLTGNVTLKASSGIKVWDNSTKGTAISLPKTYSTPSDLPKNLYIEGYTGSTAVRDQYVRLEYVIGGVTYKDEIKVTVIDIQKVEVDSSDADSHKIDSVLSSAVTWDHFVTVKGSSGNITLKATIVPDTSETRDTIDWVGMTQDGSDELKATRSRTSSGKVGALVHINGNSAHRLINWIVWATLSGNVNTSLTPNPINSGTYRIGTSVQASYACTATITPSSMFDQTKDIPDLTGANATALTGTNAKGDALSGGANKKWDISRRISRVMNYTGNVPALTVSALDQNISFPVGDSTKGNDDATTTDEVNDPYTNTATLSSIDTPGRGFGLQGGDVGSTYENLTSFQEFVRLELNGNWYVISGNDDWSVQFRFIKTKITETLWALDVNGDGDTADDVTEAMIGSDQNGDGDTNDTLSYWDDNSSTAAN